MNRSAAAFATVALWVSLAAAANTDASWWAYTHVHVVNEFGGGRVLTVHCKSRDDNMGTHWVGPNSEYEWRFRPSIFGNTLFWCHVWKGGSQIVYDAYYADDDKLYDRVYMDNSYWVVKDDGLYLRQFWKGVDVFWRPWP
ncbi:unnamed protein product [Linum tenue]|uniref:S-protein homolog n=2 Tax=Linum tenue TaxID=586396 RepID=A0AAV0KZZ0_9ROSI|nr:unnamed protein product [Linum tenue]